MDKALECAIEAAGSKSALARFAGVTRSAVCQWRRIPPERCLRIEAGTGIPKEVLRPDIYPPTLIVHPQKSDISA